MKALPEAHLVYPGSTVLWTVLEDGTPRGNGEPTHADVRSALDSSASVDEVRAWFDKTLRAAGWTYIGKTDPYQYARQPPSSTYCEEYGIDAFQAPGPGSPDPPPPAGGTYYETILTVPNNPSTSYGRPDASGNAMVVACGRTFATG